jgi:hypothetical protein
MAIRLLVGVALLAAGAAEAAEQTASDLNTRWTEEFARIREETRLLGEKALPEGYGQKGIPVNLQSPVEVVCSRTQALLNRIAGLPGAPATAKSQSELTALQLRASSQPEDMELFVEVCKLRQRIALSNPLLDFDALIFTAYEGEGLVHLNNVAAVETTGPGAGLYVVRGIKSGNCAVVDLLENAPVANGRYQGKILSNKNPQWASGAIFNSLALSYDAREIVFSWTQSKRPTKGVAPVWNCRGGLLTPETTLHLFKINTDGTNLRQLTDTRAANDYHPCWHADGKRIIFISDRMLNSERCGGNSVTGNLFIMDCDGQNLYPLSWHETSEWYPSIDNNGMLIYTRWDYVDRHPLVAHNMWISYPDGRDPRAYHGNYGGQRPMTEVFVRAIPGSLKYMALASGHHSHPQGNIVLLDMAHKDGSSGQATMFWPGMVMKSDSWPGRKSEIARKNYYDPWPLGEDFALVGQNSQIILVDRFRNEILLYDAADVLQDKTGFPVRFPTPLKPRRVPPCIPDRTYQGLNRSRAPKATIAVVNVMESDFAWPADTKITALRIIQILPKPAMVAGESGPVGGSIDNPRIGYASQSSARMVLGTVPVEADGSAYFEAPVEREIYFQALDEQGMAVATMLSGTYVRSGEQLTCVGCHEDKSKAPAITRPRMAFQRPPSRITPDVDGSCPLNYHRLVRIPVFEKKCLPCHLKEGKGIQDFSYWKAPDRQINSRKGKADSIAGEIRKHVRYYELVGGRSKPKDRLAHGSPLLKHLSPSHHGVHLTPEEFHRVTLWLDANSLELGTYDQRADRIEKQRRGEVVWPEGPPPYEGVNYYNVDPANPAGTEKVTATKSG